MKIFILTLIYITCWNCKGNAQKLMINKPFLTGRYSFTKDTSFVKVGVNYSVNTVYLKKETYRAYLKMYEAALKDGVKLTIISGTRSFDDQLYKWNAEWNDPKFSGIKNTTAKVKKLLRWWSMPGTSRHHWGTDIDLTNLKLAFYKTPKGKRMYEWLSKNASTYGFYQPFNANRQTGYQEEKWHWSYLSLSRIYLKEYLKQVTYNDINGFSGWQAAKTLDVINTQVLAINAACK